MSDMFTVAMDSAIANKYVIPKLAEVCESTYGKRFKNYGVEISPEVSDNTVSAKVGVYNGADVKKSGVFKFSPYDEYFDQSDFLTHLNTSIVRFVKEL